MLDYTTDICVVCNGRIKSENRAARQIDGLWLCSSNCISTFLEEKKKWNAENWDAICKLQALYEERKREESNHSRKAMVSTGAAK